jgi:hypothetical protein
MQLTSKRIEVSDALECVEYFYRENMTDGLPVVPPTEARVRQFLDAVALSPDARIAEITERASLITAEKLAINAVMAGCLPEYMPVLIAAVEALADPLFKFNHLASLGSPWPMVVVSGPIVRTLAMNHARYVFGSGNRANATIGRAISLLLWNCCELRPDAIQRGDLGNAHRYSICIAENPDTAWQGLNEWEGFERTTSTVTVSWLQPVQRAIDREHAARDSRAADKRAHSPRVFAGVFRGHDSADDGEAAGRARLDQAADPRLHL